MEKATKHNNYHYNSNLKKYARANRKTLTKSATHLWQYLLKKRQLMGYEFKRERPILNYIVDFVCLELMLVIEVDGITHENEIAIKKDQERDQILQQIGFTVFRFKSSMVLDKLEWVRDDLHKWIKDNRKVVL